MRKYLPWSRATQKTATLGETRIVSIVSNLPEGKLKDSEWSQTPGPFRYIRASQ
jgi:hypothetical protein